MGGFCACTASNVTGGAGLSSSAAFSVLVGTVLSRLYNGGRVPATEIARAGQYAENEYFGKPSGLMDQMAAAVGGFVGIDFGGGELRIEPVQFDFGATGHSLCIVDTRGSHADLTDAYAAVRREMNDVAEKLGKHTLSESSLQELMRELPRLREACGDRAVLRGLHFMQETRRAVQERQALQQGRFDTFLGLVNDSGESSAALLQNIYRPARGKTARGRRACGQQTCAAGARRVPAFTAAASAGRYRHLSRTSCSTVTAPRSNMYSARAHVSWSAYAVRAGSNFRQVHNGTAQQNNCASGVR